MSELLDNNEHGSTADYWGGVCAVYVEQQRALGQEVYPRAAQLATETPILGGMSMYGAGAEIVPTQV